MSSLSDWDILNNEFIFGWYDWLAFIKPICIKNKIYWGVTFSKGDPNSRTNPIYCDTAQKAFSIVESYKEQKHFNELINKLISNNLIGDQYGRNT